MGPGGHMSGPGDVSTDELGQDRETIQSLYEQQQGSQRDLAAIQQQVVAVQLRVTFLQEGYQFRGSDIKSQGDRKELQKPTNKVGGGDFFPYHARNVARTTDSNRVENSQGEAPWSERQFPKGNLTSRERSRGPVWTVQLTAARGGAARWLPPGSAWLGSTPPPRGSTWSTTPSPGGASKQGIQFPIQSMPTASFSHVGRSRPEVWGDRKMSPVGVHIPSGVTCVNAMTQRLSLGHTRVRRHVWGHRGGHPPECSKFRILFKIRSIVTSHRRLCLGEKRLAEERIERKHKSSIAKNVLQTSWRADPSEGISKTMQKSKLWACPTCNKPFLLWGGHQKHLPGHRGRVKSLREATGAVPVFKSSSVECASWVKSTNSPRGEVLRKKSLFGALKSSVEDDRALLKATRPC